MSKKFHNFRVKNQESSIGFENLAYLQSIGNKCKDEYSQSASWLKVIQKSIFVLSRSTPIRS